MDDTSQSIAVVRFFFQRLSALHGRLPYPEQEEAWVDALQEFPVALLQELYAQRLTFLEMPTAMQVRARAQKLQNPTGQRLPPLMDGDKLYDPSERSSAEEARAAIEEIVRKIGKGMN